MIHTDAMLRIAEQRGCELRTAAHRHRLQRYAATSSRRRSAAAVARRYMTRSIGRRRRLAVVTAPVVADTCCPA